MTEQTLTKMPKGRSLWQDGLRRLKRRKLAVISFFVISLYFATAGFIFVAELCDWQPGPLNWGQEIAEPHQHPSKDNEFFGTDWLGRSVWRKTLHGAKVSMTVAVCASILSICIGLPLGAIAGYFRGIADEIIVWLYTTLYSIPYILLILAFAVVLRDKTIFGFKLTGITSVYIALGVTSWVPLCRMIRGEVIKHKERDYVLAARSFGCSKRRIIFKHLLPNVFHIVIIDFSIRFVYFIHAEVILSYLGLGVTNEPSWGSMINTARMEMVKGVWWEMAAATIAIFFISLALNIFGDALRDCLDPKLRTERN
ncbi:MAG: ABC transporter permease [Sedimentisphaerales bacterium]|nr:ABC transporter permease [Sedimentisphaerales bacterium]